MVIPKFIENGFSFYPLCQTLLVVTSIVNLIHSSSILSWIILLFFIYFLSPLIWFGIRLIVDKKSISGVFKIGKNNKYTNAWLISHYLQAFYNHFSFFEKCLKIIPGFYSLWLRCWGSKIGKNIIWTPGCEVVDRGYLNLGDRILIGNNSYLSAHVIKKVNRQFLLYVKPVKIESDSMISFANVIGPGVTIERGVQLQAGSHIYPNQVISSGGFYGRTAH